MATKNKILGGIAYGVGFGAGICAGICAGQVFDACVPVPAGEVQEVVHKVGKWGCRIAAHSVVSDAVQSYTSDILEAGEMSAEMLKSLTEKETKKA